MTLVAQTRVIEMPAQEVNLQEVISYLEEEYGFLFSYKNEAVKDIKVTPPAQPFPIQLFLSETLKNTKFEFEIVDKNFILLSDNVKTTIIEDESKLILLCGFVRDLNTQKALIGANIYLKKAQIGVSTDENGQFSLVTEDSVENDNLVISYIGYKEKRLPAVDFIKKPCQTVSLDYLEFDENMVVVKEYLTDGIKLKEETNSISFQPAKIGTLPGQAEPDVLNTIQFLPGITSPDGSASNICIRGGTPDQNLILWEDIPVYHSAHYFGMISAFNPYIIDEAEVFRGGFSSDYGGRISGVIDLKSKDINQEKPTIGVGVNMVNPYVYGKIPLLKNKASIVFSLRRSMAEIWRSPTYESITRRINQGVLLNIPIRDKIPPHIQLENNFWFLDSNIKGSYQLGDNTKISLAYFVGDNKFDSQITDNQANKIQADTLNLENSGISIALQHNWSQHFSTTLTSLQTDFGYVYDYGLVHFADNRPDNFGVKTSNIKEQQIKLTNTYQTIKNHQFKLGLELIKYDVNYKITNSAREREFGENRDSLSDLRVLHAAFNSSKEKNIGVDVGVRFNHFQKTNKFYLEPRLRLWYKPTESLNIHAHAGKYYQYLSQLVEFRGNNNEGIETAVWSLTGEIEVPVLEATQLQMGAIFDKNSWLIDGQIYFKRTEGLTSLATGFSANLGANYQLGTSNTKGFDLLIKKRWKGLRTWISYTLSKSDYLFPNFFDKEFAAPNDQRHIFNFALSQSFGKFKCSLGWRLATGRAYSLRENFDLRPPPNGQMGPFNIVPVVPELNSGRLPNEHRLDATISYSILPKNGANWRGHIGLSLFNIYNQNNVYSRSFFTELRRDMNEPVLTYANKTDMGFTPNFVLRFEF